MQIGKRTRAVHDVLIQKEALQHVENPQMKRTSRVTSKKARPLRLDTTPADLPGELFPLTQNLPSNFPQELLDLILGALSAFALKSLACTSYLWSRVSKGLLIEKRVLAEECVGL